MSSLEHWNVRDFRLVYSLRKVSETRRRFRFLPAAIPSRRSFLSDEISPDRRCVFDRLGISKADSRFSDAYVSREIIVRFASTGSIGRTQVVNAVCIFNNFL